MQKFIVLLGAAIAALQPSYALSQGSPLIIDRGRPDRAAVTAQKPQPPTTPRLPGPHVSKIKPFVLRHVRIEGSSLTPPWINAALKPYIGTTVDEHALARISNSLARLYAERGDIALYTVTVPTQAFKNGVLHLVATEGYIEYVDIKGLPARKLGLVAQYSRRLMKDRPLKRSTLQRTLSLLRDIPGLTVDVRLLHGNTPGAVRMVLTLTQKPWHLTLSANDAGSNPLGRFQFQAKASRYGLLTPGEETSLIVLVPAAVRRFQYVALTEAVPLNDNGLMLQAALGYLRTRPKAPYPEGNASNAQVLLAYPLLRNFEESLTVSGGIDGIDSSNATLGEIIANERIRALRLSGAYAVQAATSAFAVNVSLSNGLNIFGAHTNSAWGETDFKKATLQASYTRLFGRAFVGRLRATGQWAFDRLPVSELYGLGGDIGRAFPAAAAMGDSGLGGAAEIGYLPPHLPKMLQGAELFGFADGGTVHTRNRLGFGGRDDHLASAGIGIRLPLRQRTKLELAAANGLYSNAPGIAPGHWRITFSVSTAS